MKNALQTNIAMNDSYDARPTQFSIIQTIHCNFDLKCFFSILPKCLLLSLCNVCIFHWYFAK